MALHIQDEEADRLLREFARKRGIGLTAAVKVAVTEANANVAAKNQRGTLAQRVQPLIDEVRAAMERNNTSSDDVRRFIDEGWDGL